MFLNSFSQFLNYNIFIVPVCASMKFLQDVDNIHTEGTVSQIFDIGPSFYFVIKNGKFYTFPI